jgi:outer membrane lipoprotein SlyB
MSVRTICKLVLVPGALASLLAGCAVEPTATRAAAPPPAPRPTLNIYFYPQHGQSAQRQDRDRYECYLAARKQTGYDPSVPTPDGGAPVRIVAVPRDGSDTLAGAATGAVIGAAVSDPWHSAEGAAIGAVAGAVIGAVSDDSRQRAVQTAQSQQDAKRAGAEAQADAEIHGYRDAMKACLSARGYSVE